MEAYPDQVTYDLVAAASKVLQTPADDILQAFGEYWVLYTGQTAYASMMRTAGGNLRQFLINLDNMHLKISFTMPHLQPPSFQCEDIDSQTLRLHYYSERAGLAPMVVGLLRGLSKRFEQPVEILHDVHARDSDHDEFVIRFLAQ
jgi:hypothetical protein